MKGTKELLTVLIKQKLVKDYSHITRDAFVAEHADEYNRWLDSEAGALVLAQIDKALSEADDPKVNTHLAEMEKRAPKEVVAEVRARWEEMMAIVKNAAVMDLRIEPDEAKRLIDRLK